jgi:2-oxoglutarate dehydrogenase E1 component
MSRQDANAAFALSSFLYGGNAAYIEDLYARFEADPNSLDAEWRDFFGSLKDNAADVEKSARGASWKKPQVVDRDDTLSALDGQWAETEKKLGDKVRAKAQGAGVELSASDVQQATRDSVRALMLIRAYRIRGHFHADLDPLGLEPRKDDEELDPRSYGFGEADLERKIFLDKVLGLEFATMREIVAICQRTYCQTLASARSSTSSLRPKASRNSATPSSPAPSASASTAARR